MANISQVLHGSFSWTNSRTKLTDTHVTLSKRLGVIKIHRERFFPENTKLKTVRIKKENDKFFIVFSIELLDKKKVTPKDLDCFKSLGMDTNNGHLDFSDGSVLKYERSRTIGELKKLKNKQAKKLVRELEKKEKLQQKQSKRIEKLKATKQKAGKNFYKTQKKINKIDTKIKNRRKNLLDKVSNEFLSKRFDLLFIEKLEVKKMTSKKNDKKSKHMSRGKSRQMRKNILNFSYSTLHMMLEYKAMLIGRLVIRVDPRNTTKQCSNCGQLQNMKLSQRKYICSCGLSIDRDLNSAINIHQRGLGLFAEINPACLVA